MWNNRRQKIQRIALAVKERESLNQSPLVVAILLFNRTLLQLLYLNNSTYLNQIDVEGNTPLHYAVKQGNLEAVDFLLEKKTPALEIANNAGMTPLKLAETLKHTLIYQRLQKCKGNLNLQHPLKPSTPVNSLFFNPVGKSDGNPPAKSVNPTSKPSLLSKS